MKLYKNVCNKALLANIFGLIKFYNLVYSIPKEVLPSDAVARN